MTLTTSVSFLPGGPSFAQTATVDGQAGDTADVVIERDVLSWSFSHLRLHQDGRVSAFPTPAPCREMLSTSRLPDHCLEYRGQGNARDRMMEPHALASLLAKADEAWRANCQTRPAAPSADWIERVSVFRREGLDGQWVRKVVFAFDGRSQTTCGPGEQIGTSLSQSIPQIGRIRSRARVAPGQSVTERCPDAAVLGAAADEVLLLLDVDTSGTPRDVTLLSSSGQDDADAHVLACARRLKYQPDTAEDQDSGALALLEWARLRRIGREQ